MVARFSISLSTDCGGEGWGEGGVLRVSALGVAVMTYAVERATRASRAGGVVALVLAVFLATFPFWADAGWMREFNEMACYLIFAMMWNLLAGYGGMVSIGQQAFLGLGGFALLVMGNFFGINPFVAGPIAAPLTLLVAPPGSLAAFRLQGGDFAPRALGVAGRVRLSLAHRS